MKKIIDALKLKNNHSLTELYTRWSLYETSGTLITSIATQSGEKQNK